jgi:outer membrane protein
MKKNLLAVAVLCALTSGAAFAQQAESPWLVRVRAVHLDSANKDSTGLGLSVNNKTIPEVDISYFFNKNVAAELILTVPQKHDLSSSVLGGRIGSLKHLPPSLLLQYHFDAPGFKPYVGAGVNYTRFSNVNLPAGGHRPQQLGRCPAGRRGRSTVQEPELT